MEQHPAPEAIDLFFFDTLGVQRLDSYQQITPLEGNSYGLSGTGVKRLVALSAQRGETSRWIDISTYGNLCKHSFSLERENPDRPLLAGQTLLEDGASRQVTLPLQSLLSAIRIRSVACDFRGRPYEACSFNNSTIFLSYAVSEVLPLVAESGRAVSWMNQGDLDSVSVMKLPFPEMLHQNGYGEIGPNRITEVKVFYCYSNGEIQEGMPRTRLVLAGSVEGKPCYYPIELPPLKAGVCYELDITLRRMGSDSPDTPVKSGSVQLQTQIFPWEERANYIVTY